MSMPQPDAERSTHTLRRVVVIEDDEAFRQTVQRSLQLAGF